ncbi:DUF6994 family protein [Microbacterium lacticum]
MNSMQHDYKRDILGSDYDTAHPVRNWLRYRLITKKSRRDCDRIALRSELADVRATGLRASADTMNSFWTTYARALELSTGRKFLDADAQLLLDRHDDDGYREINEQFAEFAVLTHTRGNFVLMPMHSPAQACSLNQLRNLKWRDYWDLTLASIRTHELDDFFGNYPVREQFDIPKLGGFDAYVQRHSLGAYVSSDGEVLPLWDGHLDADAPALPATPEHIEQFLVNVTRSIVQRATELAVLPREVVNG